MEKTFRSGFSLRWLNTAGFEMILPGGAHLLVDPWLDSSEIYPFPLAKIERADYVLLTHAHFDHAASLGEIQKKFPTARMLIGDLSAEALAKEYHLNLARIFRVRGGECYEFDDVRIDAISARHTEGAQGSYWMEGSNLKPGGVPDDTMWYGTLEMYNYRITAADGSHIVVWGGMTTDEQINRMRHYSGNDVAVMHVSPKQDYGMFASLVKAINPKVVIPHHYDIWDVLFKAHPETLKDMPLPREQITADRILGLIAASVEKECPYTSFFVPEHHKWYDFGFSVKGND